MIIEAIFLAIALYIFHRYRKAWLSTLAYFLPTLAQVLVLKGGFDITTGLLVYAGMIALLSFGFFILLYYLKEGPAYFVTMAFGFILFTQFI